MSKQFATLTPTQYENAKQHLLSAFNECAPSGKEQAAFATYLAKMENDGVKPERILSGLADSLAEGLAYGAWPS